MQLRVTPGPTEPLPADLRAGRHEPLISTRRPTGRAPTSTPLMTEDYVLVAAPTWATRLTTDSPGAAAADAPLIAYTADLPIACRYWRSVFGRQLTTAAAATVPDLRGVLTAVVAGPGGVSCPATCAPRTRRRAA